MHVRVRRLGGERNKPRQGWLRRQWYKGLLAVTMSPGDSRSSSSSSAHPSASDLNSVVRFKGRQLRYLDGNACTEYEEESDV